MDVAKCNNDQKKISSLPQFIIMKTSSFIISILFAIFNFSSEIQAQSIVPSKINPTSYKNEVSLGLSASNPSGIQLFVDYRRQLKHNFAIRATAASIAHFGSSLHHRDWRWSIGIEKQFDLTDKWQAYVGLGIGQQTREVKETRLKYDQINLNLGLKYQFNPRFNLRVEYAYFRSYLTKNNETYSPEKIRGNHQFSIGSGMKF